MRMPFGKYKGKQIDECPDDYLLWVCSNCKNISDTLRREIEYVLNMYADEDENDNENLPVEKSVIDRWYGKLAREFHPDCGGSHAAMKAINRAKDLLVQMAGVA